MARRSWRAHPDSIYAYEDEFGEIVEIPHVSRDAQINAVLDGIAFTDRSGGMLLVAVGRQPTDLPGEALTTAFMVEWRTGPHARIDPEAEVRLPHQAEPEPELPDEPPVPEADHEPEEEPVLVGPDGADESRFPEEDVSEVPEAMR